MLIEQVNDFFKEPLHLACLVFVVVVWGFFSIYNVISPGKSPDDESFKKRFLRESI